MPDKPKVPEPMPPKPKRQDVNQNVQLKNARTLLLVAAIAGPVSMIVGGVLLSSVALVCAIVSLIKIRAAIRIEGHLRESVAHRLTISCVIILGVALVALVLNMVNLIIIWPALMEIIESNSFESVLGSLSGTAMDGSSASGGNSIWG